MSVSNKYIAQQGPVIATILGTAAGMVKQQIHGISKAPLQTPSAVFSDTCGPLSSDLVNAYIRSVGGDPSWYRGQVPAHLLPQWCFPLQAKTMTNLPYALATVLNGGCRLEMNGTLPRGKRLQASAQLTDVDDSGSVAVLTQRLTTGTADEPEAVTAEFYPLFPLKNKSKDKPKGPKKRKSFVPKNTREVCRLNLTKQDALDFAKLTGDFNPIHWVDGYAKMMGFRGVILHGFGSMAHTIEALNRNLFLGDVTRLKTFDCKFTRPLHLPAEVGVYIDDENNVFLGDAPNGPAYLTGSFETR